MADAQPRSHRLRISGINAHVRVAGATCPCQLEELSADGAFLRCERVAEIGSMLEIELAKPGDRKPLHLRGVVLRTIPGRDGQHHGLDVEFRLVPNDEFGRLVAWLDEMRSRATQALSQLPGIAAPAPAAIGPLPPVDAAIPPAADDDAGSDREKLMLQIKGLLLQMDDLRDRLRMRDIEIDDLRRQLSTAELLLGKRS
jgi:PilZ domain